MKSGSFTLGAVIGLVAVGIFARFFGTKGESPTKRKQKSEIKKVTKAFRKKGVLVVMPKVGQA